MKHLSNTLVIIPWDLYDYYIVRLVTFLKHHKLRLGSTKESYRSSLTSLMKNLIRR